MSMATQTKLPKPVSGNGASNIRRFFTDRSGVVRDAYDYGYKGWPIGGRKSKKKK